jgi:DNA-binding transcriptional LysR family regulator
MKSFFKQNRIALSQEKSDIVDGTEARYQAVRSGLGIGMFVDICVEKELASKEFFKVLSDAGLPSKWLYFIGKKRVTESEKLKRFKKFIIDHR